MPDIWVDVDTAVVVPVNILPLLDDTDGKSIEPAIVYNSAGMALVWNFVTCAGVVTGVVVTPTTAGVYDWSEPVANQGMYAIEIPASGGVSANNDTEGVGWFTGVCTGVLPWRGPTIGFRRAALNDLFIEGGTASTNLEDFFDGTGYAGGTAKLTVDVVTNNDKTGYALATPPPTTAEIKTALEVDGSKLDHLWEMTEDDAGVRRLTTNALEQAPTGGSAPTVGQIADAVWDEAINTGHSTANTAGKILYDNLNAPVATVDTVVDGIATTLGAAGAGLTALGDTRLANLDAAVSTRSTYAGGAVASVTAPVTAGTVSDKTGYSLTVAPPTAAAIADAVLDEALSGHTTPGSAGAALSAAGAAADPLASEVPGAYADGTAGKILGTINTNAAAAKAVTDKLNGMLEVDGAVNRFTQNAVEQAPGLGDGVFNTGDRTTIDSTLTLVKSLL